MASEIAASLGIYSVLFAENLLKNPYFCHYPKVNKIRLTNTVMDKYLVHCLLNNIKEPHKELVDEVASKFDTPYTLERAFDAHFTICGVETDKIQEIEDVCADFCKKHKKTPLKIDAVETFFHGTVYLAVNLSPDAKQTLSELICDLNNANCMNGRSISEKNIRPHVTVAESSPEKMDVITDYVKNKKPYFEGWFDNLAILKKVGVKTFSRNSKLRTADGYKEKQNFDIYQLSKIYNMI